MTSRLRWTAFLTVGFGVAAITAVVELDSTWAALFFAFCSGAYAAVFVLSIPTEDAE